MRDSYGELHPSRSIARRMYELETELQRARMHQRRDKKNPENTHRWGLETPETTQQEEGWFITYLDMMTLLLVVMIVMLGFSGSLGGKPAASVQKDAAESTPVVATVTEPVEVARPNAQTEGESTSTDLPAAEPAVADATPHTEPMMQFAGGGEGPLPGGTGLFPGEKRDGPVRIELPTLPAQPKLLSDLYPGWSAADFAASMMGPPRPDMSTLLAAATGTSSSAAPHGSAPDIADEERVDMLEPPTVVAAAEAQPETETEAEDEQASEGETLAAGLSLDELGGDVEVVVNERSVSFRVNSEILFDTSQADLSRSGLAVLRRIVTVLAKGNHEVTVEGHTDSVPVRRNVRYPSNWELSSARAGSVVRYLHANGIAKTRLKAVGYADTRPIGDNNTPDGRARNRRVELVIEGAGEAQ